MNRRFLIISCAFLLLLLGPTAQAQSTSGGDNGAAYVEQVARTGAPAASASITETGLGDLPIDELSIGVLPIGNLLDLLSGLGEIQSTRSLLETRTGSRNGAAVTQRGTGNRAAVTQRESTTNFAIVNQQGSDNQADLLQENASNTTAALLQIGDNNVYDATLVGSNNTTSTVAQIGDNNSYQLDFRGTDLRHFVVQYGNGNDLSQTGTGRPVSVVQSGGMEVRIRRN